MSHFVWIWLLSLLLGLVAGLLLSVWFYPQWEVRKLIRTQKRLGYSFGVWNHLKMLADHHMRMIVKPNCETLYAACFIRRKDGPYVLHMPAFDAYFSFAFLNMNTDVEGYITNCDAKEHSDNDFIIAWNREDMSRSGLRGIRLNSRICWIIGRFELNGPDELPIVNAVQDKITLKKLEDYLHAKGEKDQMS
jgi:hypothetical protein